MAKTLGGMIRFFSAWSCLDCFQRGFCDITSIKCNSVTSKIFQKCLIIVPKVWEVTHNVFHHPWHIYQMDFYYFFSSTKDFTFDFSMSHCYTRYRSEEISPGGDSIWSTICNIALKSIFNKKDMSRSERKPLCKRRKFFFRKWLRLESECANVPFRWNLFNFSPLCKDFSPVCSASANVPFRVAQSMNTGAAPPLHHLLASLW